MAARDGRTAVKVEHRFSVSYSYSHYHYYGSSGLGFRVLSFRCQFLTFVATILHFAIVTTLAILTLLLRLRVSEFWV